MSFLAVFVPIVRVLPCSVVTRLALAPYSPSSVSPIAIIVLPESTRLHSTCTSGTGTEVSEMNIIVFITISLIQEARDGAYKLAMNETEIGVVKQYIVYKDKYIRSTITIETRTRKRLRRCCSDGGRDTSAC